MFLGSTCIYPREAPQPMKEEYLLTSPLEYTNEPYAIAKIAGIKMCESYNIQYGTNFLSVMPTNLYGPNDNFDLEKSHVLPALIRKIHLGKCLEENNWEAIRKDLNKNPIEGIDGKADEQQILEKLLKYGIRVNPRNPSKSGKSVPCEVRNTHINIGTGKEISIKNLAELVKEKVGFKGKLYFNTEKPDGTLRKLTDVTKLHSLGWHHKIEIEEGVEKMYGWYVLNEK